MATITQVEKLLKKVDRAFTPNNQRRRNRPVDVENLRRLATLGRPEGDSYPVPPRGRGGIGGSAEMTHNTPQPPYRR